MNPAARRYGRLFLAVLAVFYGAWALLWFVRAPLYPTALYLYGVRPVVPKEASYAHPPLPFFDLEGVISWSECARKGVDVYRTNPCDPAPYHRPANYSPLLVDLPLQWIGTANSLPAGLILGLAFLAVLPFVFRPRTSREWAVASLAAISQAVFYAIERANIDLVVFLMIALAGLAGQRSFRARAWLYGAAIAGMLIKFYPAVLMATALRERLRDLVSLAIGSIAILALFVWWYAPQLHHAAVNLPWFHQLSDMFGAAALGLSLQLHYALPGWVAAAVTLALLAGWGVAVWRLLPVIGAERLSWTTARGFFLLCGSILMLGCFLLQTNNGYRAVFLLFLLPGLMERQAPVFRWAVYACLFCLWAETFRINLPRLLNLVIGHAPRWPLSELPMAFYTLRELAWWFVAAVMAAVIIRFVRESRAVKEAVWRLGRLSPFFARFGS